MPSVLLQDICVVVGHGRSPEGKGWGRNIDSCATVIRMWDNEWQPKADYGTKYDYGLFVLTPKSYVIFAANNKRQPDRGWWAYQGKSTEVLLPVGTECIDPTPYVEEAKGMGGAGLSGRLTLTRGTLAAAHAIQRCSRSKLHVVLVGFDNVVAGVNQPVKQSFNPAYWALYMSRFKPDVEKVYPIGGSKTATHDMAIEYLLLCKLADQYDVALHLAEDLWK